MLKVKQPYTDISDAYPIIVPKLEAKLAKYGAAIYSATYLTQRGIIFCLPYNRLEDPIFWNSSLRNMENTKGGINPTDNSWRWDNIGLT